MKKQHLFFSAILLLAVIGYTGCGQTDTPETSAEEAVETEVIAEGKYICPCGGCPEIVEDKPGSCSKCGMELVLDKASEDEQEHQHDEAHEHAHEEHHEE